MRIFLRIRECGLFAAILIGLLAVQPSLAQPMRGALLKASPDRSATSVTVTGSGVPAFHPSRVIVRFRAAATPLSGSGRALSLHASQNIHLIETPPGLSVAQAMARYRQDPNVLYVEPDYRVSLFATPTDPGWSSQWDMVRIAAPAAWDLQTSSAGTVVAIVDTGIDYAHPDLAANIYTAGDGTRGYSCLNGACVPGGADDHGHGTHVAGTIGAVGNNGVGIAGLNWSVKLLSIKFLDANGSGNISDAVLGYNQIASLKAGGVNIRVTNNSWGGSGYSQALKDAMAALEGGSAGVVHVCAAGNNGSNADVGPMYPAAYDNRGIVSVLAADASDAGASFTNYGLASVDIAAPGVNIYSTASTGTCTLCDPSGYRSLNGTSMASPHVAGVAAALLSRFPGLTAVQARDALLHPNSYDAMTESRAQTTSTGGRLNFFKTLTNPFSANPFPLNGFPVVTAGPNVFTNAGGSVSFSASASDPDGDPLRIATGRGRIVSPESLNLFEWQVDQRVPYASQFTAPAVSRTMVVPFDTVAADNRGGGSAVRSWATIWPMSSTNGAPTVSLTLPATGTSGNPVPFTVTATDPEGKPLAWEVWAASLYTASAQCCYQGASGAAAPGSITFGSAGVYRLSVQAMDPELNASTEVSAVISIDGATGTPPIVAATVDKLSGVAPLTVNVDMSASRDPDGTITQYYVDCGVGYGAGSSSPLRSCTFDRPGTYWLLLSALDNAGLMGVASRYVVVHPTGGTPPADTTPPTVTITSPAAGATVTGTATLQASAADTGGSGLKEVEYYLDTVATASSLGKSTTAPYSVTWNASTASAGAHTIRAVARDNAGNASTPASVGITVASVTLPTVSLAASTLTVAKRGTVTFTASTNAPTYGIARVDFLVNGAVVCSDTTAAYTCAWKAPAAAKIYPAQAKAYDSRGNVANSNTLSITVR